MKRLKRALREIFQPDIPPDASLQRKWEMRVEGPMLIISIAFIVLYAWSALGKAHPVWSTVAQVGMWLTWVAFVVDYVVRLILAENRSRWFIRHIWELAIVVLPMFRALRVLRVVPILVLMQRYSASSQRVSVALYTAVSTVLLILVAAISIFDLEAADPGSKITNFGDALWWSIVTVTTVGYGEIVPVSAGGRIVGVVLMSGGIALAGVVTATVASWLVEQVDTTVKKDVQAEPEPSPHLVELNQQLAEMRAEIAALRREVARGGGTTGSQDSTPNVGPDSSHSH
ncbi:potassium channel family protein [Corynebacterium falsenii]|uniref:potassium channel family protein n=1 Tax=Corynebacterium falsenii TaxID=108486 RepID=UPI001CCA28AF|nr:potassium channel family protein [Corynebacterium falsenii]UBI06504.1 potassium channel family protein [Corynebacterium falsenii]